MALKFFWNGIKGSDGKLQGCSYSDGELRNYPVGTITIYKATHGNNRSRFSGEICNAFTIENDSDMLTDYFEADRIRVIPSHPLYAQVKAAMDARTARYAA